VDVGLFANSAWGHVQRAGGSARLSLHDGRASSIGLGVEFDGWFARPPSDTWPALTGRQDFSAAAEVAGSLETPGGTALTTAKVGTLTGWGTNATCSVVTGVDTRGTITILTSLSLSLLSLT
jgi:hypothetical protein